MHRSSRRNPRVPRAVGRRDRAARTPAASPIEMPSRSASNGRHGAATGATNELKPCSVESATLSTPPITAASQTPAAIARAATREHLGTRRAGGRYRHRGPAQPEDARARVPSPNHAVPITVEIRRQRHCVAAGRRGAQGELRRENARRAGAHEHADALRAVPAHGARNAGFEAVLRRAPAREPVVAAIECASEDGTTNPRALRHGRSKSIEARRRLEIVGAQAAAVRPQRIAHLRASRARRPPSNVDAATGRFMRRAPQRVAPPAPANTRLSDHADAHREADRVQNRRMRKARASRTWSAPCR